MGTFRYEAIDRHGSSTTNTIEAPSLNDASQRLREREVNVISLAAVDSPSRQFEPAATLPPPVPRELSIPLKSIPGAMVLVIVGGIFAGIASVMMLIGIGSLLTNPSSGDAFFTLFPLLHLFVGLALLGYVFTRIKKRRRLYASGEVAMATVDGVGYNRALRVNGRHPYELVWSFELDGHRYHDKKSTFDERSMSFEPGDRIWVIYDPADPEESVEWPPFEK